MHGLSKLHSDYTIIVIYGFIKQFTNSLCPYRILNDDYGNVFHNNHTYILLHEWNRTLAVNDVITLVDQAGGRGLWGILVLKRQELEYLYVVYYSISDID